MQRVVRRASLGGPDLRIYARRAGRCKRGVKELSKSCREGMECGRRVREGDDDVW